MSSRPPAVLSLGGIVAALGVILALLPDYDVFIQSLANLPDLFTFLTGIPTELVIKHGSKYILALALALGAPLILYSIRTPLYRLFGFATLVVCAYGMARMLSIGAGWKGAFSIANASFLVLFLVAAGSAMGSLRADVRAGIVLGIFTMAFAKLIFSLYVYHTFGGIELFAGIPSLAADGGILGLWSLASLWSFAFACDNFTLRRKPLALFWSVLFVIFAAALAATFRRENMLKLLATLVLMIVLSGYLRRRAIKATLAAAFAAILGACVLAATMFAVFGATDATDRIFSLSKSSDSRFAGSNKAYEDDWYAWVETIVKHQGLGVGPGQRYGVDRYVEGIQSFQGAGLIPLHTGTYELAASFGVVGFLFQIVVFVIIPVTALRRARARRVQLSMIFPAAAASLLWFGLWPFGPPFYYDAVGMILMGIQAGIVCRAYTLRPEDPLAAAVGDAGEDVALPPVDFTPIR